MGDLQNPRAIYLKGWLFLLCGSAAGALLLLRSMEWRTALLLAICVWCFCRFYYFAFYVIQHYVDPGFRFAGLFDFAKYAWRQRLGWRAQRLVDDRDVANGSAPDSARDLPVDSTRESRDPAGDAT